MNILPKKSWHVLSRDNLERVRRDEAEAKRQEEERGRRAALADQEAKIEFMRKRSRAQQVEGQYEDLIRDESTAGDVPGEGHINFFADLKTGIGLEGSVNKEHELEKKKEQEKWEKKVGVLTYLVDKDDSSSSDPWYLKKRPKNEKSQQDKKILMDPLNEMKGYVETKKKYMGLTHPPAPPTSLSKSTGAVGGASGSKPHKSKKKRKKEKEEEERRKLEKLRAERRQREEIERIRSAAALKKHYGGVNTEGEGPSVGKYNNQYNPHLSRTKS